MILILKSGGILKLGVLAMSNSHGLATKAAAVPAIDKNFLRFKLI
jgi:hypothetical protein